MNGLLYVIEELKKNFDGEFFITHEVKKEVYDNPLNIKQFELGALGINNLIVNGVIKLPEEQNISRETIAQRTRDIMEKTNHAMHADGEWIQLVSDAEISCFALALEFKEQNVDTIVAIDERTARMLAEQPENLKELMSQKLHRNIEIASKLPDISGISCIRSSELVYVAYKKGLVNLKHPQTLEALLYATKFKGSSISWDEIETIKRL